MRPRICLIGDSQLAALKLGFDRAGVTPPDFDFVFFGGAGGSAHEFNLTRPGMIIPAKRRIREQYEATSGGHDRIRLADYQAFVIVSLGLGLPYAFDAAKAHRLRGETGRREEPATAEALVEAVQARLGSATALEICRAIRRVSAAPILLVPAPAPVEPPADQIRGGALWRATRTLDVAAQAAADMAPVIADEAGADIQPQPPETLASPWFTLAAYGAGSAGASAPDDQRHMNAEYGALVAAQITEWARRRLITGEAPAGGPGGRFGRRLCLIGNSHLAALKRGYDDDPGSAGRWIPTFFGAPGRGLSMLVASAGVLSTGVAFVRQSLALTSGGLETIRMADYDAFLIVGAGFGLYEAIKPETGEGADEDALDLKVALAVAGRRLSGSPAAVIARAIRAHSDAPIRLIPTPMPLRLPKTTLGGHEAGEKTIERFLDVLHNEADALAAETGLEVIWQPEATLRTPWRSRGPYAAVLAAEDGQPERKDPRHLNGAYGAMTLADAVRSLS